MDDTAHILRAVALAERAAGRTSPNPMVGCVIVKDGEVIGEGWHQGPGTPHAEPAALAEAGDAARGATAYVTLEPCNHYGNTPPCSEALIAAGVAEVVYAAADPNPLAAGGADRLRAAGIRVRHVLVPEADRLIRPWVHGLTASRPYVYAKLAMSLDGRTATKTGESKWITGPEARTHGHLLRQRTDAIIVGVETVLADDPGLDPRPEGVVPAPSLKIVMDSRLRTPAEAKLLSTPGDVLIFTTGTADWQAEDALREQGAEIIRIPSVNDRPSLSAALAHLKEIGCQSVMIEGGGTLLSSVFDDGLVDEVWAYIAPLILGGGRPAISGEGPDQLASAFTLADRQVEQLGTDLFIRGTLQRREEAVCSQAS
ncbi:bifunctional diaminohydroxyphosphoribosylaminopyrimidine deaminase/5-amino-6-(5-phosphoribosylamino)uracil reductase RibD [Parvularcula marina]|uniref:bifunctional diaminohydroxyphosphoribosylaminopyrimidine deaminase/5-amino-6-(5-phosphoribosylamino)uracil reductase RibD n=1 Tax=Parvularcula marina TaxID=2292771 RepID=UPI0018F40627|nr:bifunctional diaminohydroxyphosphoribosylaminopyrimidine deaminase/5-amino-6-(5-phosphoribosylamino)uracil reductase RibD [Parvularcula marina]